MQRKAVIFSANEKLSKYICNELRLLDYSVEIRDNLKDHFGNKPELIIFDTISLDLTPSYKTFFLSNTTSQKIAILNTHPEEKLFSEFDHLLLFPFSLEEFRSIVITKPIKKEATTSIEGTTIPKCFFAFADRRGVTYNNTYISLSEHEFSLLEILCKNTNTAVSREEIKKLFNISDGNIADVYICHLRNKLELPFGIKVIYTLRGKGYMTDYTMKL